MSSQERAQSGKMRLVADHEIGGDEVGDDYGWECQGKRFGCGYYNAGLVGWGYDDDAQDGWPCVYFYVGGLEMDDKHSQDGVNVLYLDWHAEFDARAMPSPIGKLKERDGMWTNFSWEWTPVQDNHAILLNGQDWNPDWPWW